MEGLIFYWISWCAWIIATFFLHKQNRYRTDIALFVLWSIILSPYDVSILGNDVSIISFLFFMIPFIYFVIQQNVSIFSLVICSFITCLAYVSFMLFELYDPIWLVFKREWMLTSIITFIAILLQQNFIERAMVVILGTVNGDIIFSLMLKKLSLFYPIGALAYLDVIAMMIATLFFWTLLENVACLFDQYYFSFEREKRKQL